MGKGKRRKSNKVKAKANQRSKLPAGPTSVNDLPDELLDAVLLNLGSPLHLIRAAATCRRWRRAIADAGFLARSRALHGAPPVAGRYYVTDRLPPNASGRWGRPAKKPAAFVPSSPAVVDAGHFSLDFLYVPPVDGDRARTMYYNCSSRIRHSARTMYYNCSIRIRHSRSREIIDSRGSLLLLTSGPWDPWRWSPDFIVCEPVTRRYQGIARPADLSHLWYLSAFLLDGGGAGDAMSNFRVLSVLYERGRSHYQFCAPRACMFTPGSDGGWRISRHTMDDGVEVPDMQTIHFAGRTAGKVYWGMESSSVLVLDESTLKFSLLAFPAPMQWPNRRTSFRVIGGVDGGDTVRVVRMDGVDLVVFGQLLDSGEWVIERSISLRDATAELPGWKNWLFRLPASIVTADNTFMVLTPGEKPWFFSVDLETMEVENDDVRNREVGPSSYPCALPWPPVLQACVNHGDATSKKRHTRQCRSP
ncbi:unnamed protein product [Miscanthus lutarioriparius]|uniref:F-box domain-containing protein n=1 Tax=Miscanthus lutarioriparius TaxID=422564 RepID=A0A811NRG7_9POAL|nr:unnamed protein product [Miscanthus lutarioriparius]